MSRLSSLCTVGLIVTFSATAQFVQQGNKLVGTGTVGPTSSDQGRSVSISSDGNTAIVGGSGDNNSAGAAWIWTRSGGVWTQQGSKLVGTGAVGIAEQGFSVSLSSDGNTAIVGGPSDNSLRGAAWVWTRSGGIWSQQGSKLVGTGAVGNAEQGWSVSLSSDGNTAIVGGYIDSGNVGASWVWTRSGGVWTQQGSKLVGTGGVGTSIQGVSLSLSSDGNTAIVGGYADNVNLGAAWVFTRSGGVWTQQGNKLVGTGAVGTANQGFSVSISSDGNTAIVGGFNDNGSVGAAWVWTRSGGVWTQQGGKLAGIDVVGSARQGYAVSISSDGNKAIVGGYGDNGFKGAAWVWKRSGGVWIQLGSKLVGTGASGNPAQGHSVAISSDGKTVIVGGDNDDITGGAWIFSLPSPPTITSFSPSSGPIGMTVTIKGTNFNTTPANNIVYFGGVRASVTGGNVDSLVVVVPSGAVLGFITVTSNQLTACSPLPFDVTFSSSQNIDASAFAEKVDYNPGLQPRGVAVADFDNDGKPDIVVSNYSSGTLSVFRNISISSTLTTDSFAPKLDYDTPVNPWKVVAADFNGDGKLDVLVSSHNSSALSVFRNTSTSGNISFASRVDISTTSATNVAVGDLDADGELDIAGTSLNGHVVSVFKNTSSDTSLSFASHVDFAAGVEPYAVAIGDLDGDGKPDLVITDFSPVGKVVSLFRNTSVPGVIDVSSFASKVDFTTDTSSTSVALGDLDGDGKLDMIVVNQFKGNVNVFRNVSTPGSISVASFEPKVSISGGVGAETILFSDVDGDGKPEIVSTDGNSAAVFKNTTVGTNFSFMPKVAFPAGQTPYGEAAGDFDGDGKPDLVTANYNANTISIFQNVVATAPLPVGLTQFGASVNGWIVALSWRTATEVNNYGFEVQRRIQDPGVSSQNENEAWRVAGFVAGAGISNDPKEYSFTDSRLSARKYMYRLKQIDRNGAFKFSQSVEVEVGVAPRVFALSQNYPNPFNPSTNIEFSVPSNGRASLKVLNMLGQVVATPFEGETEAGQYHVVQFDASSLATGVYFSRLEFNKKMQLKKMLLLK